MKTADIANKKIDWFILEDRKKKIYKQYVFSSDDLFFYFRKLIP